MSDGKKRGLRHDILLIAFGAIISFVTTIATVYLNHSAEQQQNLRAEKLNFNKEIAEDIGDAIAMLGRAYINRVHSGTISNELKLRETGDKMNSKREYYRARLSNYYGLETKKFFEDSIITVIVDVDSLVWVPDYTKSVSDSTFSKYRHLKRNSVAFLTHLYKKSEE